MADYTLEELKEINAKQSRIIKSLEADEKGYTDAIKVQAETISLLMKPGSNTKELKRCLTWLSANSPDGGEEMPILPSTREMAGLPEKTN